MLEDVQRTTTATLNATQAVANAVKQAIHEDADPHIMAGALVEGIIMMLLARFPVETRRSVGNDLLVLLCTRLDSLDTLAKVEKGTTPDA